MDNKEALAHAGEAVGKLKDIAVSMGEAWYLLQALPGRITELERQKKDVEDLADRRGKLYARSEEELNKAEYEIGRLVGVNTNLNGEAAALRTEAADLRKRLAEHKLIIESMTYTNQTSGASKEVAALRSEIVHQQKSNESLRAILSQSQADLIEAKLQIERLASKERRIDAFLGDNNRLNATVAELRKENSCLQAESKAILAVKNETSEDMIRRRGEGAACYSGSEPVEIPKSPIVEEPLERITSAMVRFEKSGARLRMRNPVTGGWMELSMIAEDPGVTKK